MKSESPALTIGKEAFDAVIFDLDGVITRTAELHAAAWKALFDKYLERRSEEQEPFDIDTDYRRYVDGKPRYQGVQSFLESRGIELPYGDPDDDPDRETVCGLGNRKNELFRQRLQQDGVKVYESSVELLHDLREQGIRTAIVSSSKNCQAILDAAGIRDLFDARIDGVESARLGLNGKPDPDIFLEAARRLGVEPARAIVVEDATSGVDAGRRGGFGRVVGVDRVGHAEELKQSGADIVVEDLAEIEVAE